MKQSQEWWCLDLGFSSEIGAEDFDRLLESLLRFTPDLVPGRKRVFLEMSRVPARPKPDAFLKRVQVLARRIGSMLRLGASASPIRFQRPGSRPAGAHVRRVYCRLRLTSISSIR